MKWTRSVAKLMEAVGELSRTQFVKPTALPDARRGRLHHLFRRGALVGGNVSVNEDVEMCSRTPPADHGHRCRDVPQAARRRGQAGDNVGDRRFVALRARRCPAWPGCRQARHHHPHAREFEGSVYILCEDGGFSTPFFRHTVRQFYPHHGRDRQAPAGPAPRAPR